MEKSPSTGFQNCLPELYLGACKFSALGMTWKVIFKPFLPPKKVQKNFTLFENSLFSLVSGLRTLPMLFPVSKRHPPMPQLIPRILRKLSCERIFSPAKISLSNNLFDFLVFSCFRPWEHQQRVLWNSAVRLAAMRASEIVWSSKSKGCTHNFKDFGIF